MTSEVLRKLEAKGLIVRTVDAADTRAKKLRVTARGAELAIQDIAVVEAADDRENGKQQHVRQLVKFALGATRIGNCRDERKEMFERLQGNLQMIRSPHIDSDFFDLRNPPSLVTAQFVETCCVRDSV